MTAEQLALEIRKLLLVEGNMSDTQAAKLAGLSQQNFSAKLKAGTLRYLEVAGLLDEIGYKIDWQKNYTARQKQADEIVLMDFLGDKYDALHEMGFEIVRRKEQS